MSEEVELTPEEKILAWVSFYKFPLIFAFLAIILLGGAFFIWQSNNPSDEISFSQEETEAGTIKVDIEGAILKPGVYELPSGSRISDLLIKAGGLTAEADRNWVSQSLNLAAKLTDGGKVYIPVKGETAVLGTSQTGITQKININSASAAELDKLSGVGPVTAQKIINGRPYQSVEELLTRKIITQSTFEKIKESLSVY